MWTTPKWPNWFQPDSKCYRGDTTGYYGNTTGYSGDTTGYYGVTKLGKVVTTGSVVSNCSVSCESVVKSKQYTVGIVDVGVLRLITSRLN